MEESEFKSSTNYINALFIWIAIITFLPGLLTSYGEKYLPSFILQFVRYGRANESKKETKFTILKWIEVPKKLEFLFVYKPE